MVHLIPAGTGSAFYKGVKIKVDEPEEELPQGIAAPPSADLDDDFKADDEISSKKSIDQA